MNLLFANPIYHDHNRLDLRWSDDQLHDIVATLDPHFPASITENMLYAIASCGRSMVTEKLLADKGAHYSRSKGAYPAHGRYRDGDPYHTHWYVTHAMDALWAAGLIEHHKGHWGGTSGMGRQSVGYVTDDLVALIGRFCDTTEPRALGTAMETIVLRSRDDKRSIDYTDDTETHRMREQVAVINNALAQLEVVWQGKRFPIQPGRRVFAGDWDRGGRFYCLGLSHQNIRSHQRRELTIVIDGAPHPVIELDYSHLHPAMAYAEAGKKMPKGDLYDISGYDRTVVKIATQILFNAANRRECLGAIGRALHDDEALREASGLVRAPIVWGYHSFSAELITAIRHKHRKIRRSFHSDSGARWQRRDSDMAVEIMLAMIKRTGRCPLPVHDSFLVADVDEDALREVMTAVAQGRGLSLQLQEYRAPSLPTPQSLQSLSSLHMWGTVCDQQLSEDGSPSEEVEESLILTGIRPSYPPMTVQPGHPTRGHRNDHAHAPPN